MRLPFMFAGAFVLATLISPLPGPGARRTVAPAMADRMELCDRQPPELPETLDVQAESSGAPSPAWTVNKALLKSRLPQVAPNSAKPPNPTRTVIPELDLGALGLVDPRKALPIAGKKAAESDRLPSAPPRPTALASATILADLKARLPAPPDGSQRTKSPEAFPELDLAALGLADPRKSAGGASTEKRASVPLAAGTGYAPDTKRIVQPPVALPQWWRELDTDHDGQIGLYEWRKGGRSIEEFIKLDRNGDGLLTADEYRRATKLAPDPVATKP